MATDNKGLRYPQVASRLIGKLERMAVHYAQDDLERLHGDAFLIASLFGFTTESDQWADKAIEAHDWQGNQKAKETFRIKVGYIREIMEARDALWKETQLLQNDEAHTGGALMVATVNDIGYQVSLLAGGAEIAYSLRDFGGSPTESEQDQMEAILHQAFAHYMDVVALALRKHFDSGQPLDRFSYSNVDWYDGTFVRAH